MLAHIYSNQYSLQGNEDSQEIRWCVHGHRTMEKSELKPRILGFKRHTLFMNLYWFLCRSCICHWKIRLLPEFSEAAMIEPWFLCLTHGHIQIASPTLGKSGFSLFFTISLTPYLPFLLLAFFSPPLNAIQIRKVSSLQELNITVIFFPPSISAHLAGQRREVRGWYLKSGNHWPYVVAKAYSL